jgi:cytochrome c oxidase assembly protein subunit 11
MSQTDPFKLKGRGDVRHNRRLALGLLAFVAFMVGLSFAAVPLYRVFCAATGYGGTPQRADRGSTNMAAQTIDVRFDANTAPGLPWTFEPVEGKVTVRVGENKLAFFRVVNNSKERVTGSAVFNVSPELMGQYFTKVQCFCFTEQMLRPGEEVEIPVSFFIDPVVLTDPDAKTVTNLTLSYTFHRVKQPSAESADAAPAISQIPR